nr:hypothetical protein Iba_chr14cCG14860 [Ipomoea batatas]
MMMMAKGVIVGSYDWMLLWQKWRCQRFFCSFERGWWLPDMRTECADEGRGRDGHLPEASFDEGAADTLLWRMAVKTLPGQNVELCMGLCWLFF